MTLRTAIRQGRFVTAATIMAAGWVVLVGLNVLEVTGRSLAIAEPVGQTALSGIVGVVVLTVGLALLVTLFGELGREEPTPDPFPPES